MCGINGFNWKDEQLICKMNSVLKQRGPDDEGTFVNGSVSLGHRRLSILDLSLRGHQPMCNEDGCIWIVYNGEIYNFKEIRDDLTKKGHKFKSDTDTEVIIHAYEEFGFDCVKKFNGIWAFCIYDDTKNILFLSRDRFGVKPLYYYFHENRFIFSSEIKSILMHDMAITPNDSIIFDFLYYNLTDHTEETFFDNIKRLMPSHNAIFDLSARSFKQEKYYDIQSELKEGSFEPSKLKDLFTDAVRMQLIADVPIGSCLSGGIDSSSIVLTMNSLRKNNMIKTFSAHFPGRKIDERKYQDEINKLVNSEGHFVSPKPDELMDDLTDLIYAQEEPFPGTSIYAQYRVMKMAHENGMKVLLDGQGADEIFAGYHYYYGFYFYELFKAGKFSKILEETKNYKNKTGSMMPIMYMMLRFVPNFLKKWMYSNIKTPYLSKNFISSNKLRNDPRWNTVGLTYALLESIQVYSLPPLLRYEDKNSMHFSIESRVPFLDHRLVEYTLSMPSDSIITDGTTKWAFRTSMKGILPESIRCRYDKIGFSTPEEEWFHNSIFKQFTMDIINSESFSKRKYWDANKVKQMFDKMLAGKTLKLFAGTDIWRCVTFELWLRMFIDSTASPYNFRDMMEYKISGEI